jgi:hypothetical protein
LKTKLKASLQTSQQTGEDQIDAPLLLVLGALISGAAFAVSFHVGRPLWLDDTHSTHHAFHGLLSVVENLRTDSHPPLYFLLLSLWIPLVGLGEIVLRIPSILFYLASGAVLFSFGRKIGGIRAGLLTALFFLLNPIAVYHSQGVRPYALLGFLSAVSTVIFLTLADPDRRKRKSAWSAYFAANVLGTLTHYWFFFLLAGQGLGALVWSRGKERIHLALSLFASAVPFAVLWTPVLLEQLQGTPTTWMEAPGGFWLLSVPVQLLGGRDHATSIRIFLLLLALACLLRLKGRRLGLVGIGDLSRYLADRNVRHAFLIPAVVMIVAFLLSQISPVYHVRYVIVAVPAVAVFLSLTLTHLGERRLVVPLALIFVLGSCLVRIDYLGEEMRQDDRSATEFLVRNVGVEDEILNVTLNYAPTAHYLRALAPEEDFSQTVFPREVANHVGWRDAEGMAGDTTALRQEATELARSLSQRQGLQRVWLLAALPERGRWWLRPDSVFTAILSEALRAEFELEKTIPSRGWWHREIQVYTRP